MGETTAPNGNPLPLEAIIRFVAVATIKVYGENAAVLPMTAAKLDEIISPVVLEGGVLLKDQLPLVSFNNILTITRDMVETYAPLRFKPNIVSPKHGKGDGKSAVRVLPVRDPACGRITIGVLSPSDTVEGAYLGKSKIGSNLPFPFHKGKKTVPFSVFTLPGTLPTLDHTPASGGKENITKKGDPMGKNQWRLLSTHRPRMPTPRPATKTIRILLERKSIQLTLGWHVGRMSRRWNWLFARRSMTNSYANVNLKVGKGNQETTKKRRLGTLKG